MVGRHGHLGCPATQGVFPLLVQHAVAWRCMESREQPAVRPWDGVAPCRMPSGHLLRRPKGSEAAVAMGGETAWLLARCWHSTAAA